MSHIRHAALSDLPALVEIDNYYVLETPVTFHTEALSVTSRRSWFDTFTTDGRHQLLVVEEDGEIQGYAGASQFRAKTAYQRSVETTIYLRHGVTGRGLGRALYAALFEALSGTGVRRLVAGITLPNAASTALHEAFGFQEVGVMHEIGFKFDRYWDVAWYERVLEG